MKRREFLHLGGAAVATSSVMSGSAAAGPLDLPLMDRVLARFDEMLEATRTRLAEVPGRDEQPLLHAGLDGLWTALVAYSAFVELPLVQQVHPGMQRRIRQVTAELSRAIDTFVAMVAADDTSFWARLEEGRARLPETRVILDAFDAEARRFGLGDTARRRFLGLLRRSVQQLRRREVRSWTRELVGAATRDEAPPLEADAPTTREVSEARGAWTATGLRYDEDELPREHEGGSHRGARVLGLVLIVIGGTITFVGLVIAIAYYTCFCIGALIALAGLAFLIPGLVVYNNAVRKDREEAP
jgi:hypothetical protein